MSRTRLSLALVAATSLICGAALAQTSPPAAVPPKPAAATSTQPSTATKVENWTTKQWNAAKQEWSKDKAKWAACDQKAKDQKLSGRKSWSYLYDCMAKV